MRWKNIDVGTSYYFITATFTEWLPLMMRADVRAIVCDELKRDLDERNISLYAYVLMPDHLHIIVYLREVGDLHMFNHCWRGRSARRIIDLLKCQGDAEVLDILRKHADGDCDYSVWKEQVRALAITNQKTLEKKVEYIHRNPLRRGLVELPEDWLFSSYESYMKGEEISLRY